MCGFLLRVGVLIICVLVFTVFCVVCTVFLYCLVYVYYLFCLYWCKDYCHRVKTQLQEVIIIIIIIILLLLIYLLLTGRLLNILQTSMWLTAVSYSVYTEEPSRIAYNEYFPNIRTLSIVIETRCCL